MAFFLNLQYQITEYQQIVKELSDKLIEFNKYKEKLDS